MAKLALVAMALLGMLALAAAVDAETQKKHHERYEHEEHNYIEVKHKEFEWEEIPIKTHPCAPEYEILGSTVAASAKLTDDGNDIGNVYWTGIVAWHDIDHDSKDYKAAAFHNVKVNYEVIFEIEGKGQIITKAVSTSIFSETTTVLAVLGGTGHYVGATGTITWTAGPNKHGKYSGKIWLPKVHDKDYGEYEYKDYKY